MSETIVILVNGEVLAGTKQSTIDIQKKKATLLAEGLLPILMSDFNVTLMHGNKPQVGYVLFRSEAASHVLHRIPLDICGADTQGATGYMVSQALMNTLRKNGSKRSVMAVITQTVVDKNSQDYENYSRQIGPWLDRDQAEQRRQLYNWNLIQKPGYGFRRVVPSPPPLEILELDGIKQLSDTGTIVVAAGGGGVPVVQTDNGSYLGLEVVVDTDHVASILANKIKAKMMLMVIEDDEKFLESGLDSLKYQTISKEDFRSISENLRTDSDSVLRKVRSIDHYLMNGGELVIITTIRNLKSTLTKKSGLWIGKEEMADNIFSDQS